MTTRIDRVQDLLKREDRSALIATPGADMAYLLGHFAHASERPQLFIIPAEGRPVIVMSAFESRALPPVDVNLTSYSETDNVYDAVAEASRPEWWSAVLISDVCRADVLLRLQARFPSCRFHPSSPLLRSLRMIKDDGEVNALREAGRRADAAWDAFVASPMTGATELELGSRLKRLMEEQGLKDPGAIVASGPNGASPHHHTGSRCVEPRDFVVFDFGGTYQGYHADTTRTVAVGEASDRQRHAYEAVKNANAAGKQAVQPGVSCESIDKAARSVITDAGLGDAFIHRTGHGIGLDGHEEPYMVDGNSLQLEPGMTFSVEPGVYLEGEFGIRIEDIVVVTDSGAEVLNATSRELKVVS